MKASFRTSVEAESAHEKKKAENKLKQEATKKEKFNLEDLKVGSIVTGTIGSFNPALGAIIKLNKKYHGRVHMTDISDDIEADLSLVSKVNKQVKAVVVAVDLTRPIIALSMKDSDIESYKAPEAPKFGEIVHGFVKTISEKGCFVDLTRDHYARIKICDLSDAFIKDWKTAFPPGKLVQGKITKVDDERKQYEMSLKNSVMDPLLKKLEFSDLKAGMKVSGSVRKIEKFGIFILLDGSSISGLCHISEVADTPVTNIERIYSIGDAVQTYILKTDPAKQRVSLSLKASLFENDEGEDNESEDSDAESEAVEDVEMVDAENDSDAKDDSEAEGMSGDETLAVEGSDSEVEDEEASVIFEDEAAEGTQKKNLHSALTSAPLDVSFSWDASADQFLSPVEDNESSDEEVEKKQKTKRQKKQEKEQEEERINKLELAVNSTDAPESAEDFEKKLLEEPNNSFVWIKYMAYLAGMAETEKARQLAERALSMISFREEQEKLNVWVAYLNLENTFGKTETLTAVFDRACQFNESKKVHIQLAHIYEKTNKPQVILI
jgi:rRNA biogenesis protein RRP5